MNYSYSVIAQEKGRYLEIVTVKVPLETEQQALDIMSLCVENGTTLLMLNVSALSESFFRLATGVAGGILQKLINYHIKTAFVLTESIVNQSIFRR